MLEHSHYAKSAHGVAHCEACNLKAAADAKKEEEEKEIETALTDMWSMPAHHQRTYRLRFTREKHPMDPDGKSEQSVFQNPDGYAWFA